MGTPRRSSRNSGRRISYAEMVNFNEISQHSASLSTMPRNSSPRVSPGKHNYAEISDDSDDFQPPMKTRNSTNSIKKVNYSEISLYDDFDDPKLLLRTKVLLSSLHSFENLEITPRKKRRNPLNELLVSSEVSTTPKSMVRKVMESPKCTPRNTLKLVREGVITPTMQVREKSINLEGTPLMKARAHLHVSYLPKILPCRENEYENISNFIQGKLIDGCGGCMYISGVPGTGKTATVSSVINNLKVLAKDNEVPEFDFVGINGLKLTEPRQTYVEILKQLTGKTMPWEQAYNILEEKFTLRKSRPTKKKEKPIILLIDELDMICTKRQDVVYNLLDWPTKAKTQLVVITIANTMDLPERLLMNRVTSRLGLTRLTFQPYNYKQLQEIVSMRLIGIRNFNPDAVQLVARKVASVSGDARRALDICRRAVEMAEAEDMDAFVSMEHINQALGAMMTQPKVRAIKHCSKLEQFILQAVVAEVERTGIEETLFTDVFRMLGSFCALNAFQQVTCTVVLSAISRLGTCRLLLTDPKGCDTDQRIILNVSSDDIYYALKEE